jgi:hypothetical protein
MERNHRPIGLTALAFASLAMGMYAQLVAMAVIIGGVVFGMLGTSDMVVLIILGPVYLGIMLGGYVLAFGFWTQRAWAFRGGIAVYAAFIAGNVVLASVAVDPSSAIATAIGAAVGLAYLVRLATRASLPALASGPRAGHPSASDSASLGSASSYR